MNLHFGQQKPAGQRCGEAPGKGEQSYVPSWVPPAWKIPLIEDRPGRGRKGRRDERPQPSIEREERIPEEVPGGKERGEEDRGVVIIELG